MTATYDPHSDWDREDAHATCQLDSGAMTDCQPLCHAPATHTVTYRSGSYGPFVVSLCKRHVRRFENSIWPDRGTVAELDTRQSRVLARIPSWSESDELF